MEHKKLIFILIIALTGCNNNKSNNLNKNSAIEFVDSSKKTSSTIIDSVKTVRYDSTENEALNLYDGYIDTFSIHGFKFRLLADSENYSLQKYQNGKWINNLSNLDISTMYGYERHDDINGDGFDDFFYYGDKKPGYLFDAVKNEFITMPISFPNEWTIIDSSKKILCGIYDYDKPNLSGISELYTFIGSKIYTFALIDNISDNDFAVKKIILYTCVNGDRTMKNYVKDSLINADTFDYSNFWKTNYKSFIK